MQLARTAAQIGRDDQQRALRRREERRDIARDEALPRDDRHFDGALVGAGEPQRWRARAAVLLGAPAGRKATPKALQGLAQRRSATSIVPHLVERSTKRNEPQRFVP